MPEPNGHPSKPPRSPKDRFNPKTGARLVAGLVVLSNENTHPGELPHRYVLCISSSRHENKLVLPKGGWEQGETVEEAAIREGWEESGVQGDITQFLLMMEDKRPPKNWDHQKSYKGMEYPDGFVPPRAEYRYFEFSPTKLAEEWPEKEKRCRRWLTYEDAKEVLKGRIEMAEALERSSIVRS